MLREKEQTFALCRSLFSSYFFVRKEVAILFCLILIKPSENGDFRLIFIQKVAFFYLTKFQEIKKPEAL